MDVFLLVACAYRPPPLSSVMLAATAGSTWGTAAAPPPVQAGSLFRCVARTSKQGCTAAAGGGKTGAGGRCRHKHTTCWVVGGCCRRAAPPSFFVFCFCICAARLLSQRGLPTDTLPPSGSQSHLPNSAPRLIAQAASARCGPHIFFEYPPFHDHGQPDDAQPARMRQPLSTHSAPQKHRTKTVAGWPATRPTAAPGRYQGPRLSGGSVHRSWGWRRCAGLCTVQHIRTVLHVQYIVPIRSTRHKHVKKKPTYHALVRFLIMIKDYVET